MNNFKYIITGKTLIAHYNDKQITLKVSDKRYKKVCKFIGKGDIDGAVDFLFPATKIVKYTDNAFIIRGGNVYLKGEKNPIPTLIGKKLMEFYKQKHPYKPLIKFWKNLQKNPSENSVEQLFAFLNNNDFAITSEGFFLAYKYVTEKDGMLVDCHTKKINNNIGQKPHMDRKDVEDNPDVACGKGLHVASYEYASNYHTLIEVLVNPKDVVSVPKDHNCQKIRLTDYTVIGFGKGKYKGAFISQKEIISRMRKGIKRNSTFSFKDMTAKQIVRVVKYVSGWKMPFNLKSKQTIIKNAERIFIKLGYMKTEQAIDIHNMTAKNIISFVKGVTGKTIKVNLKSKQTIIKKAEKLLENV